MNIYAIGTALSDLTAHSSATATTSSTFASVDVCREAVNLTATSTAYIDITPVSDFWFSYRIKTNTTTSNTIAYAFLNLYSTAFSTSQALFRLRKVGGTTASLSANNIIICEHWDGSSWITTGSGGTIGTLIKTISVRLTIDDTLGEYSVYIDGGLLGTLTGDTKFTSATAIDRIEWRDDNNNIMSHIVSEWIVADEDTRDLRVAALSPTADGANTAWTGTYADVDETGVNDADFASSTSANDVETYVMGDIHSSVAGYNVAALVVSMRARRGASGPQNLQGAVRISGTNYTSSSVDALTTSFAPRRAVFTTNPATSFPWLQAAVNGAEIGMKSIT
jgi:hypothetical protein